MKFKCVDFFIDELVLQDTKNPSPFIDIMIEEQKKENEKKQKMLKNLVKFDTKPSTNLLPFVSNKKPVETKKIKPIEMEEKMKNRFIYIGKFQNFSILQTTKKDKIKKVNKLLFEDRTTQYDEMFDRHIETEQNRFDYKSFKQMTGCRNGKAM
jgi:hypothetical protein